MAILIGKLCASSDKNGKCLLTRPYGWRQICNTGRIRPAGWQQKNATGLIDIEIRRNGDAGERVAFAPAGARAKKTP
jgi:hypothetical protein